MTSEQKARARVLYVEEGKTAQQVAVELGLRHSTVTSFFQHNGIRRTQKPEITGVTADDSPLDAAALWERVLEMQRKTDEYRRRRDASSVAFTGGPVGLAFLSDQHIGGESDYAGMLKDAEFVRDTRLYAVMVGDVLNAWAASEKMAHLQQWEWLNWREAQALFHDYLDIMGGKVVAVVSGNHEGWLKRYGVDVTKVALKGSKALYDPFMVEFDLRVGECSKRVCLRHKFKGHSMYNPTHGIEQTAKQLLEKTGQTFDIGIMGHTHRETVCRPFVCGGMTRLAYMLASYKRQDLFAREVGFAPMVGTGSASLVVHEDGTMHAFATLEEGARYLDSVS